jgi:hypothetical protein
MRINGSCARNGSLAAAIAAVITLQVSAQTSPEMDSVLARIGSRIEEFYKRAQHLMCEEKVTAQMIRRDMSPEGFARVLEYDLRVELAAVDSLDAADANFVRELRKVNGRAPRKYDLSDRNTCLDPNPLTPEPLTFLLSRNRGDYVFSWVGFGKGKDANTLMFDYRPVKVEKAEFIEDEKGRDDCFQISLPVERAGRVWVDALTYDVLRIEQRLKTRVDVRVPFVQQTKRNLPNFIVVDRFDQITRYKPVTFDNPAETLLLPASIEQLAILQGAQSNRKTQVFSNYRRFLTGGRIIK